jgi:ArsR family transcriptional regulator, arsenate/arsenite/antimonite-responsive transcriptional repressor
MESSVAVSALAALAQEHRLAVFRLLVQAGRDGMSAGQIAERLGLIAPTLSFHLAQLKRAGLVRMRREGRSLIYAADYVGMNALMGYLTDNCCSRNPAACGEADASVIRQRRGARS